MYAKLRKNCTATGTEKLRRVNHARGMSGNGVRRSIAMNTAIASGDRANAATTPGWSQPHAGPRFKPKSNEVTLAASASAPARSSG